MTETENKTNLIKEKLRTNDFESFVQLATNYNVSKPLVSQIAKELGVKPKRTRVAKQEQLNSISLDSVENNGEKKRQVIVRNKPRDIPESIVDPLTADGVMDEMIAYLDPTKMLNKDQIRLREILTSQSGLAYRNLAWQYSAVKIALECLIRMRRVI